MREIVTRPLTDHETRVLTQILDATAQGGVRAEPVTREHASGSYTVYEFPAQAFIVWVDDQGLQFGPVRWGHRNDLPGQCDRWSASPFPGAWVDVPLKDILAVRHPDAM